MPIFAAADDANAHQIFANWIEANPTGFVIIRKGPKDTMLHRSSCGHFKAEAWAKASNIKSCSLDRLKLEHWAEVERVDELKKCNNCF